MRDLDDDGESTLTSLTVAKSPEQGVHGRARVGVAAAAAGFAAVVAAVTIAASSSGGRSRQFELPRLGWLFDIAMVVLLLTGMAGLVLALRLRAARRERRGNQSLLGSMVIILLAVVLALVLRDQFGTDANDPDVAADDAERTGDADAGDASSPASGGELASLVLVLAGGVVLTLLMAHRFTRPGPPPEPAEDDTGAAQALGEVLDDTIAALRREPDPRRAVIGAYARMEQTLGHHGLGRHRAEAPMEYLARVLDGLDVSATAAEGLTEAFEIALFSARSIRRRDQDAAIEALVAVRAELGVAAT